MSRSVEVAKTERTSPVLMSVPEVANYLRLSDRFVWARVADGTFKTVKIGRARRVLKASVDQFILENAE